MHRAALDPRCHSPFTHYVKVNTVSMKCLQDMYVYNFNEYKNIQLYKHEHKNGIYSTWAGINFGKDLMYLCSTLKHSSSRIKQN